MRKTGTRALRFVALAYIPTRVLVEAQARFSEDPANISRDMDQSSTARHYRQAKQNSQNPFTIASRIGGVNHLQRRIAEVSSEFAGGGVILDEFGFENV
jgi:hypothetical protein